MSRNSSLSPDNILRFLQVRTDSASAQEISQGLRLAKSDRKPLFKMLSKLKKRNLIVEIAAGRYRLKAKKQSPEAGREAEKSPSRNQQRQASGISGRLVLHQDGYGFVIPNEPIPNIEGDIFIPRHATEDAMHGDQVLVEISRKGFSDAGQRIEGRIVKVVNRAHPSVVGLFRYGPHGNSVMPYDTRIHHQVEIPPGQELTPELRRKLGLESVEEAGTRGRRLARLPELDGAVVNAELVRYPKGGLAPVGRVTEILGNPGDLGVDTEIVIRKHHLPHEFSPEALRDAKERAHPVSDADREGREDFRSLPIVTIDGESARDFDDAVYVEKRADGMWSLQVHVADVANYVRTLTALDNEARLRGTSVYFLHRAVPMLPEELSNGICSLNPHEDRLVMSALMEFDATGRMTGSRMASGVIRSAERMTYTNVNKVLEGDAEMTARYEKLAPHFRNMKELALLLNARRNEKGSIDFDLPEPVIEFDEEQKMTNITRSERNIAHRLIEEFMLAANRAVAGYLLKRGISTLHRVHEKPDAKKVMEFEELARAFGYSLGVDNLHQREIAVKHGRVPSPAKRGRPDSAGHGREREMKVSLPGAGELRITPQHYQKLLAKLSGKTEERIVSYLMLRSLKQARYAPDSLGHFALGFEEYLHFTSPIRRYPDLIVHRALKWALANPAVSPPPDPHPTKAATAMLYSHRVLEKLATETSDAERRAATAERELRDWKTAQFMEQHLGDEYDGLIVSVQKYGCFVELMEVFVEGLLPIGAIEEAAGAPCTYREHEHAIVSRQSPMQRKGRSAIPQRTKRRSWKLGDRVRVRAERIDPMRHRTEFALVD
jgi:ribonuclease R